MIELEPAIDEHLETYKSKKEDFLKLKKNIKKR